MDSSSTTLQARIEKAIELLTSSHLLPPRDGETFLSLEGAKIRLQDYAFTQGSALVVEQNDKQRKTVLFDCSRHHKKQLNTSKVEEKDRQRPNTKASFLDCKYRVRISSALPPRPEVLIIIITHAEHNHEMNPDPFYFIQHKNRPR